MICPVCGKDTFQYDETLRANKCQNDFCRFSDKVLPAPDVPISFLEYCKKNARSEEHRKYIEKVIEATKCSGKK